MNYKLWDKDFVRLISGCILTIFIFQNILSFGFADSLSTVAQGVKKELTNGALKPVEDGLSGIAFGQTIEGFVLKDCMWSSDIGANVYSFVHERNGGKLIYVAADDDNKLFSIAFHTPVKDDTGINHILQRAVLEGSEKYPSKSVVEKMKNQSIYSYMQSETDTNMTYFSVASENNKDFDNLVSVYLDSVFAPLAIKDDKIMKEVGWHYVLDPQTKEIGIEGALYNELKEKLMDKDSIIDSSISAALFPDTNYQFSTEGSLESIVRMSHKQLVDTYDSYYTPSNSMILLYGKMNIIDKLKFINENYYSKRDTTPPITLNIFQSSFKTPRESLNEYPEDNEFVSDECILTWNLAIKDINDRDKEGLKLLMTLLTEGADSPISKALQEKGLEDFVSGYIDTSKNQPIFHLDLEQAYSHDMRDFDAAVRQMLNIVSERGFSKSKIMSLINSAELSMKLEYCELNRGQIVMKAVLNSFAVNKPLTEGLNKTERFAELRREVEKGGYFQKLTKNYLLKNNHLSKNIFTPNYKSMSEIEEDLKWAQERNMSNKDQAEKDAILSEISSFEAHQKKRLENEKIVKLPALNKEDMRILPELPLVIERKIKGVSVFEHPVNGNGIAQYNLYFDLTTLTREELNYLPLLEKVMMGASTNEQSFKSLNEAVFNNTNGFTMYPLMLKDNEDITKVYPYYVVETNFKEENQQKAAKLISEILIDAKLKNKALIQNELMEIMSDLRTEMIDGYWVGHSRLNASLSAGGNFADIPNDSAYELYSEYENDFENKYPKLEKKLLSIYEKLFNRKNMVVSITGNQKSMTSMEKNASDMLAQLPLRDYKKQVWAAKLKPLNMGVVTMSEYSNVFIGFNLNTIDEKLTGSDMVFMELIEKGYLDEQIRLKGDASGVFNYQYITGECIFSTYQDKNIANTISLIRGISKYLESFTPSQEQIDQAAIKVVNTYFLGKPMLRSGAYEDYKRLGNYNPELRERIKEEILNTTPADFTEFKRKIAKGMKNASVVAVGGNVEEVEKTWVFETIIQGMK